MNSISLSYRFISYCEVMIVGTFIAIGTCYLNFFYRVVHSISLSASLVMTCFISELYKYVFFLLFFFSFVSLTSSLSTLPFQNSSLISFFHCFSSFVLLISCQPSNFFLLKLCAFQICCLSLFCLFISFSSNFSPLTSFAFFWMTVFSQSFSLY